jgi:putative flippase GtrA
LTTRIASVDRISGLLGSGAARPLRFGAVGAVTFAVQISLLMAFKATGLGSIVAYAMALAVSVQFNFIVNQLLVWHDRPMAMLTRQFAERWVTFHGCIALSLVVNMGGFVVAQMFMPDIFAAVVGVGTSTAIKFLSLDKLAFRPTRVL